MLKKIISNTLAQIFSKIITATITIVLLGILTNYFTIELFGVYNKIFNYIFIFAFLVDLGLYAITVKEISANKDKTEYIFGNILSLRLLSAFLVIFISIGIAYFLPGYNSYNILLGIFIASIFSFFSLINSNILALMQAHMKIEFSIISVVLNKIFVLGLVFYISKNFYHNKGFFLVLLVVAIGMLINLIINYFYAKTITKIQLYFDKKYIKEIFLKSLPYGIALFLSVVYTKIDIILLSFLEHGRIAERSIALYSLPLKIMDVFMIIGGFYMNSLLPSLSKNFKINKFKKIEEILSNSLKLMFSVGIIIITLGLNYKDNIIRIIANQDYLTIGAFNKYTSSDAFSIILFMILFFYLGIVFSYNLIALDKQKKLLKISIILTFVNIIGNLILIPYFSFIGAAISTVITQIFFVFLVFFDVKKYINIKIPFNFMFFSLVLGFLCFFINSYLLNYHPLGLYYDFFYGIMIFFIYSFFILKFAKK